MQAVGHFGKEVQMRKDRNQRERVTRRSETRIGRDDRARDTYRDRDEHRTQGEYRNRDEYYDTRREGSRRAYHDYAEELRREERDEREYRDDRRQYGERDDRRGDRYEERRDTSREARYRVRREEERYGERREERYASADRREKETSARSAARHGENSDRTVHQLLPYALLCLAPFAAISFVLRDIYHLEGEMGAFGNFFANFLCGLFGVVAYALPLFMFVIALRWRKYVSTGKLAKKLLLSISFLLLLSGIIHVFKDAARGVLDTTARTLYDSGVLFDGGGLFGGFLGEWMGYVLRLFGTCILAVPLLLVVTVYLFDKTPYGVWEWITNKIRVMREHRAQRRAAMYDGTEESASRKNPKKNESTVREERVSGNAASDPSVAWCEPRPIDLGASRTEPQNHYIFSDEEEDPLPPPIRRRPTVSPFWSLEDVEDAPKAKPAAPAPVESAEDPETVLKATAASAREAEKEAVRVAEKGTAEQAQVRGEVYSPFSLPVRPFPQKQASTPNTEPQQKNTAAAEQETRETVQSEEVLGAPAPNSRIAENSTQTVWESPFRPVREKQEASNDVFVPKGTPVAPFGTVLLSEEAAELTERALVRELDPPAQAADEPLLPFAQEGKEQREAEQPIKEGCRDTFVPVAASPVASAKASIGFSFDFASVKTGSMAEAEEKALEEALEEAPEEALVETVKEEFFDENEDIEVETFRPVRASVECETGAQPEPRAVSDPLRELFLPRPEKHAEVSVQTERVESSPAPEPEPVIREYRFPPMDLLNEDTAKKNADHSEEIREKIEILRETLANFNVRVKEQVECSRGPTITRYELRPDAGVSVRQVINRTDDISLNLAAPVRIEAPIPGKPAIGIEVPNAVRETVYMRTMLESDVFKSSAKPLEIPLGLGIGGDVQMCNLASMPHLLVAGTTGSGKSVCINTILIGLIYKTSPEDLRLILIDPKQIEFAPYEHIPHLYMPIVTDMQRAAGALACAVQEMERRYSLIRDVGVRDIDSYNNAVRNDPEREHLPRIVIVIDEFADLKMSCANNDPENFTCRLAQKARAAGIHLIIGTQRPSVDVITGKLKNNIPSRIAFTVMQQVDSRTILDMNGAESLTGKGDMLYMPIGSPKPARVQGAFVSDGELERVLNYVRKHNDPVQYNKAFMEQIEAEMARAANNGKKEDYGDDEDEGGEDPKFLEAVELAVETQKVATSLLQRRLGVGYGRAAKIIDRMEELGLVSAAEGNKPRKLLPAAQGYLEHVRAGDTDSEYSDDEDSFG